MTITSIYPATGNPIKEYDEMNAQEMHSAIEAAENAFQTWRTTSFDYRAKRMKAAAEILRNQAEALASLMAEEMGKPLSSGKAEAEKCAWVCDYYAEHAEHFLTDETIESDASHSFISAQPLGVILAVMPWNFPFWQVFRFAAPSLMAGNAGLLKHASNVPGCALAIEAIFREAGFPEHLFRTLLISSKEVEQVIEHNDVKAVTLTGSTPAGRAVASMAGKALKKTVLELGGNDPYIILADADVPEAARLCVESRLINSGQSCIAAKRFIAVEEICKEFTQCVLEEMNKAVVGDPFDSATTVGPMARIDLRDELHEQVQKSIEAGASCLLGGEKPEGPGAFYPPTVLGKVRPGMPAFDEELFGPVAAIIQAKDEAEAISLANQSDFGLGAGIFTRDVEKGTNIARTQLEAGACFVNTYVKSDPRLPFGGIKQSGYGRELGKNGIREFVNIKTVYVN